MTIYMTETEQIEILKTWWKRYQNVVFIGVSVFLLSFSGVKYWYWHQQKVSEQASTAYEHLMGAVSAHDNKAVRSYTHQLIESFPGTVYSDTAHLIQARVETTAGHYIKAKAALKEVITHSKFKAFVDVARLRLARILAFEQSYDLALQELDNVKDATYQAVQAELRGDIFYAKGQLELAASEYQSAKTGTEKSGIGNLFLDMKQHDVLAVIKPATSVQSAHAIS